MPLPGTKPSYLMNSERRQQDLKEQEQEVSFYWTTGQEDDQTRYPIQPYSIAEPSFIICVW